MNLVNCSLGCVLLGLWCVVSSSAARGQSAGPGESPFDDGAAAQTENVEKVILKGGVKQAAAAATTLPTSADNFCQCIGGSLGSNSEVVKNIERALKGPLHSSGLDFTEQPLNDVINMLQEDYGIPILLDKPALDTSGLREDEMVTIRLHGISLKSALRRMLKNLNLTYVVEDEVLLITTPDEANKKLITCVYDARGLAEKPPMTRGSAAHADFDPLIDAINACIAHDTWNDNGSGEAEIRSVAPGLLIISQTRAVHEEIRDLLAAIREMREKQQADSTHHTHNEADAAAMPVAAGEVVTRSYTLQLNPTNEIDTMRSQVRELITGALPDEVWSGRLSDGQSVMLTVFHDRVVVRQTPSVQEKVTRILSDSGVATPMATAVPTDGPRGFGGIGDEKVPGGSGQGGGFFSSGLESGQPPANNAGTHSPNPFQ